LIPVVRALREQGIKIATTTGYFQAAADVCYTAAERQGFVPDFRICADEVPAGRPAPWMIFRCMEALRVYPANKLLKLGDTPIDMAEAKNAGAWAVGIVDSSNEMGLAPHELATLPPDELEDRRQTIRDRYLAAGADATIDRIEELHEAITALNQWS
jgi:phosphonoacetaldehyde hydrolase